MSWEEHSCANGHESVPMRRLKSWEDGDVVYVELSCPECDNHYVADSNGGRS